MKIHPALKKKLIQNLKHKGNLNVLHGNIAHDMTGNDGNWGLLCVDAAGRDREVRKEKSILF